MKGTIPGDTRTYAKVIFDSGKSRGLSPFNLAARVVQEQGVNGMSPMISGTYPGFVGYYNHYNISASGKTNEEVYKSGLAYAKSKGWNTRTKSLEGGAAFIGNSYILKGQDTLYLQKFDLEKRSGSLHQYMQHIGAPLSEGRSMRQMYEAAGALNSAFVFKIPVFNSMPGGIPLSAITLDKRAVTIVKGKTAELKVSYDPVDTTDAKTVTWSTSNSKIATVKDGIITAAGSGSAVITAKVGTKTASCNVTVVSPLQNITLSDKTLTLVKGEERILEVSYDPVDTTDAKTVTWSTSNDKIATVKDGVITAAGSGSADITAKVGTKTAVCSVTVENPVQEIQFTGGPVEVKEGETAQISFKILPNDATGVSEAALISLEEQIAKIEKLEKNADGSYSAQVAANAAGTAILKAQAGNVSRMLPLTVLPKEAQWEIPAEPVIPEASIKPAAVTKQFYLQTKEHDAGDTQKLLIQDQNKKPLDAGLFTYTSSDENAVLIDENGVMQAVSGYAPVRNKTVTITAALTSDKTGKIKVTAKATLLATDQVKNIAIYPYQADGKTKDVLKELDEPYKNGMKLEFFHESYNGSGEPVNTKVKWSVSDTSMASVKADAQKTVVTVKKPGAFRLTCTAQDTLQASGSVDILTVSTLPVLEDGVVTWNKKTETLLTSPFILTPVNGADIKEVKITSVMFGRKEMDASQFTVRKANQDNAWQIALDEDAAAALAKGTYTVKLRVAVGAPNVQESIGETAYDMAATLKITDVIQKVTVKTPTINLFYTDDASRTIEAPVTAESPITAMRLEDASSVKITKYIKVFKDEKNDKWYLKFEDPDGAKSTYRASYLQGKLYVETEGYAAPVMKTVTVRTPVVKPVIVQDAVLALDRNLGQSAVVTLQNKTLQQPVANYNIISQSSRYIDCAPLPDAAGNLRISVRNETPWKNAQTYTAALKIQEKNWKTPVDATVRLKCYTAMPKLLTKTAVLTLNTHESAKMARAFTAIATDRDNIAIRPSKEWEVLVYDKVKKQYVNGNTDWIQFAYEKGEGMLYASFAQGKTAAPGIYQFRLAHVLNGYSQAVKDIFVKVIHAAPSASVRAAGSLDLLNRENATLTGKVTLSNVAGQIKGVMLLNAEKTGLHPDYYAILDNAGTFRIRARANAKLQCMSVAVPVRLTLEGGTVIDTKVAFRLTQGIPRVATPPVQTIYQTGGQKEKTYDLAVGLAPGIAISAIEAQSIPQGFTVSPDGGKVKVALTDNYKKPGVYQIKAAVYFKGAQPVAGSVKGKPVVKVLQVRIK